MTDRTPHEVEVKIFEELKLSRYYKVKNICRRFGVGYATVFDIERRLDPAKRARDLEYSRRRVRK